MSTHTLIFKEQKTKGKDEILKVSREKEHITYRETKRLNIQQTLFQKIYKQEEN